MYDSLTYAMSVDTTLVNPDSLDQAINLQNTMAGRSKSEHPA